MYQIRQQTCLGRMPFHPRRSEAEALMAFTVIGIRHGEVHNPEGVIYAGLPGYVLSELGRAQAAATAEALRGLDVAAIYASPLDRAMETATTIAEVAKT